jgi:hypothetical protein
MLSPIEKTVFVDENVNQTIVQQESSLKDVNERSIIINESQPL